MENRPAALRHRAATSYPPPGAPRTQSAQPTEPIQRREPLIPIRVAEVHGLPKRMMSDNGPEFRSLALATWAEKWGVELDFIEPGKPVQNAFIESFNGTLRDACLNEHCRLSLHDAQIEAWRERYNRERPHSSLGGLTPTEFAEGLAA